MRSAPAATYVAVAVARTSPVSASTQLGLVSTICRRDLGRRQPSARIGRPTGTGRWKSTFMRAVTPQLSVPTSAQAMTSSRIVQMIPPWAMPSQPSKRAVEGELGPASGRRSTCSTSRRPCVVERPAREAVVRRDLEPATPATTHGARATGGAIASGGGGRRSDVKVPDLARLGLDEVLARPDLLAHEHREDARRPRRRPRPRPAGASASPGSSSSPRAGRRSSRRGP